MQQAVETSTYIVTITSSAGDKHTYKCGGASDQDALIYAKNRRAEG